MSFKNTEIQTIMKIFYIDNIKKVFVEEYPRKNCLNYPDSHYETCYNYCDRQTAMSELAEEISPDFYLPGNNFSRVTKEPVNIDPNNLNEYMTHVNYTNSQTTTECRLPFNITTTVALSFINQESSEHELSFVLNQDMLVTRTSVVQFDPIKRLCYLRGLLGAGAVAVAVAGDSTARGAGGINCPGGGAENGVVMENM